MPVLATPINRDGKALVDGGLIENIPADVLVQKGCNFVIAVSVTAKMEQEFADNRSDTPTSEMKSASTIQTLLRGYLVQSSSRNEIGVRQADVVIEPDATHYVGNDQLSPVSKSSKEIAPSCTISLPQISLPKFVLKSATHSNAI